MAMGAQGDSVALVSNKLDMTYNDRNSAFTRGAIDV